jgi:hypothetical protein
MGFFQIDEANFSSDLRLADLCDRQSFFLGLFSSKPL